MQNLSLLILYNPYYRKHAMQEHIQILKREGKVVFGKIDKLTTMRDKAGQNAGALDAIFQATTSENHAQLFLSDYANLFVAKVTRIIASESALESTKAESAPESYTKESTPESYPPFASLPPELIPLVPHYYAQENLPVSAWFVIEDMLELVRDSFLEVRDNYLANLLVQRDISAPDSWRTFSIYGNSYVYPLIIKQKYPLDYFAGALRHYDAVYESEEFLRIKSELCRYCFGKETLDALLGDTLSHIIYAEMEFQAHITNPLYDFTSALVKYSKALEREMHAFACELFSHLAMIAPEILEIAYEVQGRKYTLADIFAHKPNYGTYKYLLNNELIKQPIETHAEYGLKTFIYKVLVLQMDSIAKLRNSGVHEKPINATKAQNFRAQILGINTRGLITSLCHYRTKLAKKTKEAKAKQG
ncbi:hypothetical protein BKN38_07435 [Helicobacter sp. CLO-3]|uniref:HP0729 family protein n=1 Tax=unclassified Helicobacter TaxID=2593540 RepID=UPI0008057DF8|nr:MULTISPECIES: HP0729 family protein [unclassified Helicobacter]OBV29066.1 hypothetical protein BA723_07075 [Helicobacter sp. CLO-3]OHU82261.1 hypothetical protein BKN38_07435 [Helicobacter sp. CLO-3]